MSDINEVTKKLLKFRKERDWKQFHNPKDMAISLSLEASEVLEHFQWKSKEEIDSYIKTHKEHIGEELADVFSWVIFMSNDLKINIIDALDKKIDKNIVKYPIEKAKGRHIKYNQL